jgi:hypothetical protein
MVIIIRRFYSLIKNYVSILRDNYEEKELGMGIALPTSGD